MKSTRIKNWPVKERPRERLIAEGAERQSDADLLAIIPRVGRGTFAEEVLGQNAPDFAKELLKEFKGLHGLDRAHFEDLKKVPGIGNAKAAQIRSKNRVVMESCGLEDSTISQSCLSTC